MNYRMNEARLQRPVFMQFLRLFSFTFHPNLCVLNEREERGGEDSFLAEVSLRCIKVTVTCREGD